ncbi:helix-turn-helix domain-containing protein [Anaerotruncus colihominis]|uniref:XRE family transcriptional regulator n=1 Tax=Anaerotruncus colihominis TaxID=169435 RepID=UPI002941E1B1|nr:helix-turn-helix domain-containing protein [Anaerotruncus colihominis]
MTFGERLVASRERKSISQKQLADMLGITPTRLNYWEKDKRQPDVSNIKRLASALGVSTDYLIGNEVLRPISVVKLSKSEEEHIKKYRVLDKHGKESVDLILDHEYNRCTEPAPVVDLERNVIPFRCSIQPVSAGTGAYLGPEEFESLLVESNRLTQQGSFGVPVSGNSMEPLYHDGNIILVADEPVEIGEIGVFTINGEGYVKKLGSDFLISLNPEYDPIPLNDSIHCNGRVIGILDPSWIVG